MSSTRAKKTAIELYAAPDQSNPELHQAVCSIILPSTSRSRKCIGQLDEQQAGLDGVLKKKIPTRNLIPMHFPSSDYNDRATLAKSKYQEVLHYEIFSIFLLLLSF
jgi:hypothetical protein